MPGTLILASLFLRFPVIRGRNPAHFFPASQLFLLKVKLLEIPDRIIWEAIITQDLDICIMATVIGEEEEAAGDSTKLFGV